MDAAPGTEADVDGDDEPVPRRPGAEVPSESGSGSGSLRVLVCDHAGSAWAGGLEGLQQHGDTVEVSSSLRETLDRLDERPLPDLLVVVPLSGQGTVELRAVEARRHDHPVSSAPVPLLVVVPDEAEEAMLRVDRALPSGHWDVIRQGAGRREVELRARRLVSQVHAARQMDELRHRAFHDDRTDLLRPMAFQARLFEHFSAAQRHGHDLALVLLDLDRFGQVNKEYDHTVGDTIIARVGEVIRRSLRAEDVAGRLGGDEFAVLLPYTGKLDAARVVSRLRLEIRKLSGQVGGVSRPIEVSASIGFETFDGSDIPSLDVLRLHAERALRVSKRGGGDCATYFRNQEGDGESSSA